MAKYIALLRGINVGGNKKVPMDKLKAVFEHMGFKNVIDKTYGKGVTTRNWNTVLKFLP